MATLSTYVRVLGEVMAAESRLLAQVYSSHHGKLGETARRCSNGSSRTTSRSVSASGRDLRSSAEQVSTQQDVVIYDRLNNPARFPESAAPLFPPSALAAVVEVESKLTQPESRKAVAKSVALKRGFVPPSQLTPRRLGQRR